MKVSDYVARFLLQNGCTHVFGYQGGAVTHLIDSFYRCPGLRFVGCCHEQGASFAAEGWARVNNSLDVAIATSGPGATNLITGIGSAYFDSIPCLYLTGQVNTYEYKDSLRVRQLGFQETDIVSIVKPIVKYAARVTCAQDIRYELEKAAAIALLGRHGPVLLDLPMNIQRAEIDEEQLTGYNIPKPAKRTVETDTILHLLGNSRRPVLLAGGGVRLAGAAEVFNRVAKRLSAPVICSLMGRDAVDNTLPGFCGMLGAYGLRSANLAAANCDLLLCLGSRLDTRQTGTLPGSFTREAKLIRVDIDANELDHKIKPDELSIQADVKDFLVQLEQRLDSITFNYSDWMKTVQGWQARYPSYAKPEFSDPNYIICELSKLLQPSDIICLDVGQNQMWGAQSLTLARGQRLLTCGGMGAMGFSLPCAIGAAFAAPESNVIALMGDGGAQMNSQELQLLVREKLPVKVIVLNNRSLGMIRHFQEMYFDARYCATVKDYSPPDFCALANAYGLESTRITDMENLYKSRAMLTAKRPALLELVLPQETYVFPKLSVNRPIEEQEPPLPREEFLNAMIIPPYTAN
ncbi:thiamine pyrophosphate-binding protein [Acetanaerobacterium elongatum]|uniref:Acetolactate synthase-1/2/3 large subunit n=1 Tax=Acetanaerobacterium elongatum TaxID=258515 RepID=A0A1H0D9K9_9FIRM|nr:thiamine pyrophosphate-binding protein [Acetanaerobacterium elongatum]SDN66894.1 acetolactate synthase-1/2/3 large subunit [Acetanaerobacterium elongatum]